MKKDLATSVRARLLNIAKAQGVDFNQVLVRFALGSSRSYCPFITPSARTLRYRLTAPVLAAEQTVCQPEKFQIPIQRIFPAVRRSSSARSLSSTDRVHAIPFTAPVEVDIIGPKAFQARLTGSDDIVTGQPFIIRSGAHGETHFGSQQNSSANLISRGKTLANDVEHRRIAYSFS